MHLSIPFARWYAFFTFVHWMQPMQAVAAPGPCEAASWSHRVALRIEMHALSRRLREILGVIPNGLGQGRLRLKSRIGQFAHVKGELGPGCWSPPRMCAPVLFTTVPPSMSFRRWASPFPPRIARSADRVPKAPVAFRPIQGGRAVFGHDRAPS